MDKLDRFNDSVSDFFTNWRNIFLFAASIFVMSTLVFLAEDSTVSWLGIFWGAAAVIGIIFYYTHQLRKTGKAEEKSEETSPIEDKRL